MAALAPYVALVFMVGGAALSVVGFLRSGVGLSPQLAMVAHVDVEQNTAAAQHDARRRRWAKVGALGFVLALVGGLLLNFAR